MACLDGRPNGFEHALSALKTLVVKLAVQQLHLRIFGLGENREPKLQSFARHDPSHQVSVKKQLLGLLIDLFRTPNVSGGFEILNDHRLRRFQQQVNAT